MNSNMTIPNIFRETVSNHPNETALVFYDKKITYQELSDLSSRFAFFLRDRNIKPGDRVAFLLPNCPQLVAGYLGALRAGCIAVSLNPLATTDELSEMLDQAQPKLLVTLKDFHKHNAVLCKIMPLKTEMMVVGLDDYLPWHLKLLYRLKNLRHSLPDETLRWRDIFWAKGCAASTHITPSDLAVLQFTGGTTGVSKAVMLTHSNLVNNAMQAMGSVGGAITPASVFMGAIPFFHVYGLSVCMNIALAQGCSVVLTPRFNAKQVIRLMLKHKVTIFPGIPRMFSVMLKERECAGLKEGPLQLCFSGAGALDKDVKREFESGTGAKIVEGYGLSETSPIVSVNPIYGSRPGSLGLPVAGTEVKIVDGELLVRGPQVMVGYWDKPKETAEVLSRDGWFSTGDMVQMDKDGFLWLTDRKKDLIKTRGENVYPSEIEKVLTGYGMIQEAAVIGVPDRDLGERIVAFVTPLPMFQGRLKALNSQEIIMFCEKCLPAIKVPSCVIAVDELPKNILGKVLKKELRASFIKKTQNSP